MKYTMKPVRYLKKLSQKAQDPKRIEKIRTSIQRERFWEDHIEWGLSRITSLRIDRVERDDRPSSKTWYRVQVECDTKMVCECPTLERAVEFLGIYELLVVDLVWTAGWPSWATVSKLEP